MTSAPVPFAAALSAASDEVLADRAADGDARAFGVIAQRYGRLLRGYAIRVLGSPTGSDDVVQDALVTAWQQLDSLADGSALRAWLIRITTRKALDHVRGRREHDDVDDVDPPAVAEGPAGSAEATSLTGALSIALAGLPETQRRVWTMRELGGLSYDEIAEQLSLPPSTVRGALARARGRLMTELDGWR